jgi:adenosylmethionine---8-amino-7-oxononanoate aminotransferase
MSNTNADLVARSLRYVWHPCTQMKRHESQPLIAIARAKGVWLYDCDDRAYLDAISSWWVNLFGHNHPSIQAALIDQLGRLDHVMLAGLTHQPVVDLSEKLAQLTGLGHAFYGSDGASATEIALKMSAHYWRNHGRAEKNRFVGLSGGYHGETVGALSVTDIEIFRDAYAPLVRLSATVPSPDARNALPHETPFDVATCCAAALEAWLQINHATTAALILEPMVQCAAGMAMFDAQYLRRARQLCDQYQVHLVVDEIATGFGRTGKLFAHQYADILPDFICLSKGLTGGTLPLSAVLTTDKVYQAFYNDDIARGFLHSHSYTGNPLACRAALATLDLFESENTLAKNAALAPQLTAIFAPITQHLSVRNARHIGMMWAWDIDTPLPNFAARYYSHALVQGVLLRPIGKTLYFMPPYVISLDEAAYLGKAALAALDATLAETADGA